MSKYRFFSTAEAAQLLKISRQAVDNAIRSGFVDPVRRGLRGRDSHLLDESSLYALCVGRALRQRKMSLAAAGAVSKYVSDRGLENLLADFRAGRTFLVVVGNATADELITRAQALDGPISPSVRKLIGPFVPVVAVDLHEAFQAFEKEVAKLIADRDAGQTARAGA